MQLAYDYFAMRADFGGEEFLQRYFEAADRIALNPWMFPVKFDDYHRALVPRTDFAICYFQKSERSVIVAVINARRNPRLIRDLIRRRRD